MSDIRSITPNPNEIDAIKKDALRRFILFFNLKDSKEMSKYVFENLYEAVRELVECIVLFNGFKIYSHEDSFRFLLQNKIVNDSDFYVLDNLRRLRNQSKYYGKEISNERLKESLETFVKFKKMFEKML